MTQASLGFPNPPFRLWGPHFCEQDPPISANHTHIFKGPKTSYHSAFSPLTWINWIVNADFPTPPPPTTTRRYFSCTEPSFQPAIGDTLLLSLRCLNTRTPSHFTLWQAFRWRIAAGKCDTAFRRCVNSVVIRTRWEKYDHSLWEMHSLLPQVHTPSSKSLPGTDCLPVLQDEGKIGLISSATTRSRR